MKFRAWDGEKWRKDFVITPSGEIQSYEWVIGIGWVYEEVDWKVVRSTGLTDKNGVEIWEGDIVKLFELDKFKVVFDLGALGYVADKYTGFIPFAGNQNFNWYENKSQRIEVVGNIFKNHELLEDKE